MPVPISTRLSPACAKTGNASNAIMKKPLLCIMSPQSGNAHIQIISIFERPSVMPPEA
jgi:hypothetical protein